MGLLLAETLASTAADARGRGRDMRSETSGITDYGRFAVKERRLANGARFKRILHFDRRGQKIATSLVRFNAAGGLTEKTKLAPVGGRLDATKAAIGAQVWSTQLRLTRSPKKMPTAAACAVDLVSNQVHYGKSGKPWPKHKAPALLKREPTHSLEPWTVDNCAEYKAVNKALLAGASFGDLAVHTVKVRTGKAFARCHNCQVTTAGTVVTSDGPPGL